MGEIPSGTLPARSVDRRGGGDDILCTSLGPNAAGKQALKQSSSERGGADVMGPGTSAASAVGVVRHLLLLSAGWPASGALTITLGGGEHRTSRKETIASDKTIPASRLGQLPGLLRF